jgi:hypothetical protein
LLRHGPDIYPLHGPASSGMFDGMHVLTATPGAIPPPDQPRTRFRLLRWLASRLPLRSITIRGKPYLDRYYIAGPLDPRTAQLFSPQLQRLAWLPFTLYLHRFHRCDARGDLHDHPWPARGMVLAGGYIEQLEGSKARVLTEGDLTHNAPRRYHRISALVRLYPDDPACETWTLFGTARKVNHWGYLVNGEHVTYEEYHAMPGRGGDK